MKQTTYNINIHSNHTNGEIRNRKMERRNYITGHFSIILQRNSQTKKKQNIKSEGEKVEEYVRIKIN